jgi:hypothetical protein
MWNTLEIKSLILSKYVRPITAARLQIHVNFHEYIGNEFNSKIFRDEQIKQFKYNNPRKLPKT